jgi:hypothetical protein
VSKQLIEGRDFYYNEQGYMVFTEAYHLSKGFCCGNGCKHCPFEYEAVPEPRKSLLLQHKTNTVERDDC